MNGKINMKVLAAAASLAMAMVLLVTGTLAWYGMDPPALKLDAGMGSAFSTEERPWPFEISLDYGTEGGGAHWYKEIWVNDALSYHMDDMLLRPISTADLIHWYTPTYDAYGGVAGFTEVNINRHSNLTNPYPVNSEFEDTENYAVYVDFWVRTDKEGTYEMRLNNPFYMQNGELHIGDDEEEFGTFLLWKPEWVEGKGYTVEREAMASARMGFLVFDENEQPENVYIFEPNVDMHRGLGEWAQEEDREEEVYLYDTPDQGVQVGEYSAEDGQILTTMVPAYDPTSETGWTLVKQETVKQTYSDWNHGILSGPRRAIWDSRGLGKLGQFVQDDGETYLSYTLMPPIATGIEKGHIKHVRLYFWLEGQDADCWNQVAGGNIFANVELRGDLQTEVPYIIL